MYGYLGILPHDLPPKGTVYHYYNTWRKDGIWQRMNQALREELRQELGREATPSAAIIDNQSVKTTEKGAVEDTRRKTCQGAQTPPDC